jgi:hypothetical protein
LSNVYYVSGFQKNLVPVSVLEKGHPITFHKGKCLIGSKVIATKQENGLYQPRAEVKQMNFIDLHRTLGHTPHRVISKLQAAGVLSKNEADLLTKDCEVCVEANIKRSPKPKVASSARTDEVGSRIHVDLFGPARTTAYDKNRYFLIIVDEASLYFF